MNTDPSNPLSTFASAGVVFLIVYLVVTALLIAIGIWISYSVIWRSVRRGMREFYKNVPGGPR
jgi:hypothetical protein